jgi:uncharacterized protein YbbK (DUF523 family)
VARCLISACLVGLRCRWDGSDRAHADLVDLVVRGEGVPVCPEQLGGLPTPRCRAYLTGGDGHAALSGAARVVDVRGRTVTAQFLRGAEEVARIAAMVGATRAYLAEGSPSCGVNAVGTDRGRAQGRGVTAALLEDHSLELVPVV